MANYNKNPGSLERARRAAKLTRKQLAELSGISERNIENYERGKNNINYARVNIVLTLAQALNVPIESILNDDPKRTDSESEPETDTE